MPGLEYGSGVWEMVTSDFGIGCVYLGSLISSTTDNWLVTIKTENGRENDDYRNSNSHQHQFEFEFEFRFSSDLC